MREGQYWAGRYLAGLCVAALGVCAGGWLVLTPFAFGYPGRGRAAFAALGTGGGLVVVGVVALACWAMLWRRQLRADEVLPVRESRRSRRSARRQARAERLVRASRQRELVTAPDPAQVLTDLRALLTPLLSDAGGVQIVVPPSANGDRDTEVEVVSDIPDTGSTEVAVPDGHREVQAPGHLRGTRSASFLAAPRPRSGEADSQADGEQLLRGAELLVVGTGEEEAW
jgi:hypothetical protein